MSIVLLLVESVVVGEGVGKSLVSNNSPRESVIQHDVPKESHQKVEQRTKGKGKYKRIQDKSSEGV